MQRVTVWSLAALTVLCAVADTAVTASFRPLTSQESVALHGWPLATLATAGAAVMGALIVSWYPGHVVGWLLSIVGSVSGTGLLAESYDVWVNDHNGPGTDRLADLAGWLSLLFSAPVAFTGFTLMLLLAPDGHLLSSRWRVAAALPFVALAAWTVGVLLTPPSEVKIDADATGGNPVASGLFLVGLVLSLTGIVVSAVSVFIRRHRAVGIVRQQLRWIAVWALTLPAGLAVLLSLNGAREGSLGWLARLPLMLSYAALPICLAIAVLRYRLYDIDVIVNRTVILACGTAFAAAGYVALVVGIGRLVDAGEGGFWLSVSATVAVALAFQPLRRRVARVADRLAYGERAVPYEALATFSQRIGETPAPDFLLPAIAQAAVHAVSARSAVVRLHVPGDVDQVVTWPPDAPLATQSTELAVADRGETLGSIAVGMPPGRAMRPAEQALLADLAGQIGLAFRNARLATELAAQVELLDRRTVELGRSRARIIEARDAESIRLERAIRRDVTSHLAHLPAALTAMSADTARAGTGPALATMIDESVHALESLRTLTRGIYSTQLAQFGLASAVAADLRRRDAAGALTVDPEVRERRFGSRMESAVYFCYVAAMRELPAPVTVDLSLRGDRLRLTMRTELPTPPDLTHLHDRLEPLGGHVAWMPAGRRSVLTVTVPIRLPATLG
jgi:hypothetical protein